MPATRSLLLTPTAVGPLALGSASPGEFGTALDPLFGARPSRSTCAGRAMSTTWGALTVTFAGVPAVARAWEVELARGTAGLRLARGTEWSPTVDALLERPDATVGTVGDDTVVTLAGGLRYRFGAEDDRARTVGAGTIECG